MPINKKKHFNRRRWLPAINLLLLSIVLYACNERPANRKVGRSFYYWKSVVKLSNFELQRLDSLQVKNVYLKFFDVDWEPSTHHPVPLAMMQFAANNVLEKYHVIPTVFITNDCMQKMDSSQATLLAIKIYGLITAIREKYHLENTNQVQIDCDWTASTAKKYFSLLRAIKEISQSAIFATIRLHQVKYIAASGIPPVDRGLLMCYNMGDLKDPSTKNSILETNELKKYIGDLSSYPLPLDVALPLFDWMVLFRDNNYRGLLENIPDATFSGTFASVSNERIEILTDTLLQGYELKKGDLLRREKSNLPEMKAAANEITKHLKNDSLGVALYHLDSVTLNKFTRNDLESIYNIFR